jgi:hypothetical protein
LQPPNKWNLHKYWHKSWQKHNGNSWLPHCQSRVKCKEQYFWTFWKK